MKHYLLQGDLTVKEITKEEFDRTVEREKLLFGKSTYVRAHDNTQSKCLLEQQHIVNLIKL